MTPYEVALRYTKALINLCPSTEAMEKFSKDLRTIKRALKRVPHWKYFFSIPQVPLEKKEEVLEKALGNEIDPLLRTFLLFVLEKGRITYLPEIIIEFDRQTAQHLGIQQARLVTATPVNPEVKDVLQKKLQTRFGKKVFLSDKVNPAIEGGAILLMGNKMIDYSIRTRLKNLKEHLLSTP